MTDPVVTDETPVTAEELVPLGDEALALMITVMQHSRQEADHILNGLAAGYQRDLHRALAELEVIRNQVEALFSSGFMPTPRAVLDALHYPNEDQVQRRIARFEKGQFS